MFVLSYCSDVQIRRYLKSLGSDRWNAIDVFANAVGEFSTQFFPPPAITLSW